MRARRKYEWLHWRFNTKSHEWEVAAWPEAAASVVSEYARGMVAGWSSSRSRIACALRRCGSDFMRELWKTERGREEDRSVPVGPCQLVETQQAKDCEGRPIQHRGEYERPLEHFDAYRFYCFIKLARPGGTDKPSAGGPSVRSSPFLQSRDWRVMDVAGEERASGEAERVS